MPALPIGPGRDLPDSTDVVVIGGGYAGINAAASSPGAASRSRSSRRTRSAGERRRATAGSSTPATSAARGKLVKRYGEELGPALYQDTLDGYETVKRLIAEEAIDCDFRECGYLELAWAGEHMVHLEQQQASLAAIGVTSTMVPRDKVREEIGTDAYHGGLVVPGSGLLHPGRYFAGLAAAADRAGADLHEGVRATAIRRQADGRFVVETERGAILARDVFVATNGYTDGVVPSLRRRIIPIGSYIIASEPLPEELVLELSPKGRAFFDTKNFLFYWHITADRRMVFGGRASMLPTSIDRTAAILHRGPAQGPPAARRIPDRLRVGRQRRLHLRPDATRRADEGRRHLRDGLLRDGRRADDPPRHEGRGVAGRWRGAGPGRAEVPARPGALRGPAVVPADRRRVVSADGPAVCPVAPPVRIGFRTSPQKTDWASLEAAWAEAGRHDVFDSGWLNDHLTDPGLERGGPSFESMTALAALAHLVPGKTVGQTVMAATFRHPSVLAKEALTLDHLTGGRFILGLGAGWHVGEHDAFGIDLPPIGERFDRYEAAVRVIKALFSEAALTRAGRDARRAAVPAVGRDHGAGADPTRRSAAVARWPGTARSADRGTLRRRLELRLEPRRLAVGLRGSAGRLLRACEAIGRDPAELTISAQIVIPGEPAARRAATERAIGFGRDGAQEILLTTPAREGAAGIRRLATDVAARLRDTFG